MRVESDRRNVAITAKPRAATAKPFALAACLHGIVEWLLVTLVFMVAGAWPTPDTNEAHYLTRARHAADPTWAAGDFFLESPEAHGLFSLVMGPLAANWSLEAAAWTGRVVGWLLLAAGFVHAVRSVVPGVWSRILAAAVFSLALRHTTAAGEWLIGGCEAKVFAWAGVLWAAGEIARDRWGPAWVGLGAATAAHAVVGGWGMVAMALTWCFVGRRVGLGWLIGGVALAAVGVVPVLGVTAGADAAIRAEAARIYVLERLPHHLLPRTFADGMIARHVLAVVIWQLLVRQLPGSAAERRLDGFTMAALAISVCGCAVSLVEPFAPTVAYSLLRFYWFRLADGLVPLSLSMAVARWSAGRDSTAALGGLAVWMRWAVVVLLAADVAHESRHWPLPGRDPIPARSDRFMQAAAWRDVCSWVGSHTPADARFIVPRMAGSFVWRTGRPEVVCWKNMPQGPQSLVEWRRRIVDCYSRDGTFSGLESHASALGVDRLVAAADRYEADHVIAPVADPALVEPRFTQLYKNGAYAVYRIEQ